MTHPYKLVDLWCILLFYLFDYVQVPMTPLCLPRLALRTLQISSVISHHVQILSYQEKRCNARFQTGEKE